MILKNLRALFSGEGFIVKSGRRPQAEDVGFRQGPLDLEIDQSTGKIVAIHPSMSELRGDFDATGLVATAGYLDSHTHALFAGNRAPEFFQRWRGSTYKEISDAGGGIHNSFRETELCSEDALAVALLERSAGARRHGTTTLEVKSGYADTAVGELRLLRILKRVRAQLAQRGPDLRPTFLGLHSLPQGRSEESFVDEMIAVLPAIVVEELAFAVDAFPEKGFFSLKESIRFSKVARANGLALKIHADELTPFGSAEAFSDLGALSVDHLQKVGPEGLAALGQRSTVACLLPATSFYLGLEYVDGRKLIQAGARVGLATDFNPGTAPWPDFRLTHSLAATQLKLTPAEILCASTFNAAAALGLNDRGVLSVGSRADICLWKIEGKLEGALEEILLSPRPPQCVLVRGRLA